MKAAARPIRLFVLTTIGKSVLVLYNGRLEYLSANGFDITVGCAPSEDDAAIRARGVRLKTFSLTRAITLGADVRALVALVRFLRAERFDLVEVATPKAALIGSLAAWLARCPRLVHILHGTVYEGVSGFLGGVLRAASYIPCRLADVTLAVSPSVRARICDDGLAPPDRVRVIGAGSINGVDTARFSPDRLALGPDIRRTFDIAPDAVVIGFVGRIARDKGIDDLAMAFRIVHERHPDTILLVVGDYDERDPPSADSVAFLSRHPAVRHVGWKEDVVPSMAAMNIFVLPTHREGLGNVLLEAAAMALPTVATAATGARDAMVDRETGLQVPVRDAEALAEALAELVRDPALRQRMGLRGRAWVCDRFDQATIWRAQAEDYRQLAGVRLDGTN